MDSSKYATTTEPNTVEEPEARVLRSMAVLMQAGSVFQPWPAPVAAVASHPYTSEPVHTQSKAWNRCLVFELFQ